MLLSITPRLNILLEEAKSSLRSLPNTVLDILPSPKKDQYSLEEKTEALNSIFDTLNSSKSLGCEHTQILMIAPNFYFWMLRFLEIAFLFGSINPQLG